MGSRHRRQRQEACADPKGELATVQAVIKTPRVGKQNREFFPGFRPAPCELEHRKKRQQWEENNKLPSPEASNVDTAREPPDPSSLAEQPAFDPRTLSSSTFIKMMVSSASCPAYTFNGEFAAHHSQQTSAN